MSSSSRRPPVQSDSKDLSSENSKHRGCDMTPDENQKPPRACKQSKTDKENMDALEQRLIKAQTDLSKFKWCVIYSPIIFLSNILSQISVEAVHALLSTKYGFVRGTSKNIVDANKTKAAQLLKKPAFHFKNPAERTGYAANTAISSIRELASFKDKDAVGVLFPSRFNPISLIGLEMTVVEYGIEEWSTGVSIPAKGFYEKYVAAKYCTHLADAERWSACNPTAVENIRHKWYRCASETLVPSMLTATSMNIDNIRENPHWQ
ncbi:hypothetical protein B0H14DRAFT_2637228 [Mycena olivaceomarginata]|nr:hypothetical protein B0H14DRAFT_2637228 [Mycena olivaceomarginata]